MSVPERTPEEKLQLKLDLANTRIQQLERQNEALRCKLSWLGAYGPLPVETSV
jgi:hypothetical protein